MPYSIKISASPIDSPAGIRYTVEKATDAEENGYEKSTSHSVVVHRGGLSALPLRRDRLPRHTQRRNTAFLFHERFFRGRRARTFVRGDHGDRQRHFPGAIYRKAHLERRTICGHRHALSDAQTKYRRMDPVLRFSNSCTASGECFRHLSSSKRIGTGWHFVSANLFCDEDSMPYVCFFVDDAVYFGPSDNRETNGEIKELVHTESQN